MVAACRPARRSTAHPSRRRPARAWTWGCAPDSAATGCPIGALKIFTDGGMMARTAALTSNRTRASSTRTAVRRPGRHHAADRRRPPRRLAARDPRHRRPAVDVALDAHRAGPGGGSAPGRPAPDRARRAGPARTSCRGSPPSALPPSCSRTSCATSGDDYAAIMGERRAPWLYRGQGFLDAGVRLVGSSDRPVTDGAPLRAIQFMVERLTRAGLPGRTRTRRSASTTHCGPTPRRPPGPVTWRTGWAASPRASSRTWSSSTATRTPWTRPASATCAWCRHSPVARSSTAPSWADGAGQPWTMLTIQPMPNLSWHWPNSSPHICFSSGTLTVPLSDSLAQ